MEKNFTPGPWRFSDDEIIEDTNGYIITSLKCDSRFSLDTMLANAKLIAAAPELLEALQIVIGDIEKGPVKFTAEEKISMAIQAIKKATE